MDLSRFFLKDSLVPVIVQHYQTNEVLMLGYASEEALRLTVETKIAWFYSRSRKRLWKKGETSGNILHVREIRSDCDEDAILLRAEPAGPTCHTGRDSCFFNTLMSNSDVE